jgi:sensor histidine kinase YesM
MTALTKKSPNFHPMVIHATSSKLLEFIKRPVVYHGLFWMLYFTLNVFRWGGYNQDYLVAFYNNLIEFPLHIGLAYFNIYFLIPNYLPKKYFRYIGMIFLGILAVISIRFFLEGLFDIRPNSTLTDSQYLLELAIGEVYVQGFLTAFKFLLDWGRSQKKMRELEKINFETELDFLRSQVQPHFFFNTLNNLYSLTLDKSDLAPDTVLRLSELMSYVIYDGKQKKVHLSKEIGYIQNYLDLERLRFGNKLKASLEIRGQMDHHQVTPLLLLPFIENSFKHGAGDGIDEISIDIGLDIRQHEVIFSVQNKKHEKLKAPAPNPYHHIGHNGIGIENIKRRLKLIYGANYSLDIKDDPDKYTVILKIPTYENSMSNS